MTEPIPINATLRKPGPARRKNMLRKILSERDAGNGRLGSAARASHRMRAAFAGSDPQPAAVGLRVEPNCQPERF